MRFLFRWAFRLFLVLTVTIVALVLLKDTLLKSYAEHRLRSQTGMDVKIGKLQSGLFSPTLTIENFRLYNPAEFGGSPFLDLPELHVECYSAPLILRKFRFKMVRVQIEQLNIVESKNGQTNLVQVMAGLEKIRSSPESPVSRCQFGGIDLLNLTFGKVNYSSLRRPGKTTEVDLGVRNEIITNIKSLPQLTDLLLSAMFRKGITISTPPARP